MVLWYDFDDNDAMWWLDIYIHIYLYDDIILMTYMVPWLWICIDDAPRWLIAIHIQVLYNDDDMIWYEEMVYGDGYVVLWAPMDGPR